MTQGTNVVPLKSGGNPVGIVPTNIEEVFRLATAVFKSGLAPRDLNSAEKVTVAIMQGLELGLPPMFAINKIAVINGRPTLWGDAIPALLLSRGFRIDEHMTNDGRRAVCKVTRPDGAVVERSFSELDAKAAGLWDKTGPWKQYPTRMLQMRARGFAARDGAADVLGGLYLREEMDEPASEPKDITPRAALPMPPEVPSVPALPEPTDDMLSDATGFLAKLREERGYCQSEADLAELRDANAELIARLSSADQAEAETILAME